MKIIYLHQYFNTPAMTGGTRSYEMARRLIRAGHEVHLLTSERVAGRSNLREWKVENVDGITVHWLPVPYSNMMGSAQRIWAFAQFAYGAARRSAALTADLIFATSTPLTIALPAIYASRKQRIPMVLEVRDLWPAVPIALGTLRDPISKAVALGLERHAYRNSVRVVALSAEMKEGVVLTGYPPARVSVIPNGSDLDLFDVGPKPGVELRTRYDWLQGRPLVIYMGTLGLINGVDYMVRLAARVRECDPEVRFVVVGAGRQEAAVRELAERCGVLNTNFFMMGSLPKQEMPAWLSAADLATSFCIDLRATWGNSANKFFDALAARKPIAINYGAWQADLLTRTGAGLVLDAHDMQAAADRLMVAIRDQDWLHQAGVAAGRLAENEFARDRLAAQLEEVLSDARREGYKPRPRWRPLASQSVDSSR